MVFLLAIGAVVGTYLIAHKVQGHTLREAYGRGKALLSRYGGLTIIFGGAVLWNAFPVVTDLLAKANPSAPNEGTGQAFMDVSVFQTILLSGIRAVILYCFAVLMVRVYMRVVHRFWKRHFVRAFYRLTEWQKIIVSFWAVSLFVYICVSLTH